MHSEKLYIFVLAVFLSDEVDTCIQLVFANFGPFPSCDVHTFICINTGDCDDDDDELCGKLGYNCIDPSSSCGGKQVLW